LTATLPANATTFDEAVAKYQIEVDNKAHIVESRQRGCFSQNWTLCWPDNKQRLEEYQAGMMQP
jgi:hypothetical protein